jgi:nitrite reductase/ring-hydroxylating ferredoxin subunit
LDLDIEARSRISSIRNTRKKFPLLEKMTMNRITHLGDVKVGGSLYFDYGGERAILIRSSERDVHAYVAICPHEGGNIEWDKDIKKILCECHLSLFNVADGSVYKHSSLFELKKGLKKVALKIDEAGDVFAL